MGSNERTGGRILVDQLRLHGVDLVFGVPGESYLAALDALYDVPEVRYIVCRQEGGAAMMADAYGKLTNRFRQVSRRRPSLTRAGLTIWPERNPE